MSKESEKIAAFLVNNVDSLKNMAAEAPEVNAAFGKVIALLADRHGLGRDDVVDQSKPTQLNKIGIGAWVKIWNTDGCITQYNKILNYTSNDTNTFSKFPPTNSIVRIVCEVPHPVSKLPMYGILLGMEIYYSTNEDNFLVLAEEKEIPNLSGRAIKTREIFESQYGQDWKYGVDWKSPEMDTLFGLELTFEQVDFLTSHDKLELLNEVGLTVKISPICVQKILKASPNQNTPSPPLISNQNQFDVDDVQTLVGAKIVFQDGSVNEFTKIKPNRKTVSCYYTNAAGAKKQIKIGMGILKTLMSGKSYKGYSIFKSKSIDDKLPLAAKTNVSTINDVSDFSSLSQEDLIKKRDEIKDAMMAFEEEDPEYKELEIDLEQINIYIE